MVASCESAGHLAKAGQVVVIVGSGHDKGCRQWRGLGGNVGGGVSRRGRAACGGGR